MCFGTYNFLANHKIQRTSDYYSRFTSKMMIEADFS